ncbi:AAA family ATPase [Devosia sp. Root635]|uniref:AAA family ATPase n=1 Tax=Devosia sp. Root635 TaxID=1736575 RepID=UPI0006F8892D|nr:AAA family ATPase [Devosia sp. Root635]KRA45785.1 AAA family ATPase [Devosia sp. Root635]
MPSHIPPLADLGRRIVIFGPSNSGKSTLAEALSRKLAIPAVHLDQLHHTPDTDWVPRPQHEFHALQRDAIAGDAWIMDGNYSGLVDERLARATGAIVLDGNHWMRLGRYVNRTLFQPNRPGALQGQQDSLKWSMIHWVAVASRHNGARYRAMVEGTVLPRVFCGSMAEVKALYRVWSL